MNPKTLKKYDLYVPSPGSSIPLGRNNEASMSSPEALLVVGVDVYGLGLCYVGVAIGDMSVIKKGRAMIVAGEED